MSLLSRRWLSWAVLLLSSNVWASSWACAEASEEKTNPALPPIIFVHGPAGSAAQFESHALRFTSNGYPQALLYAFEYDTSVDYSLNAVEVLQQLDAFIDQVRERHAGQQVHVVGHSRGTTVITTYLNGFRGGSAKVARYVNIDGRFQSELPGGVPTLGVWGEWGSGGQYAQLPGRMQIGPNRQDNHHFSEKSHTEVATSEETFALIYRFLTGREPQTRRIIPERPNRVTVAGRAVLFAQNLGYPNGQLELWRVAAKNGQRMGSKPVWSGALSADGHFGPLSVNGLHHYELALKRPDGSVHHFYQQPFERSNHFLRLNASLPGAGLDGLVLKSEQHAVLTLTRQREFWGDQGPLSDRLTVNGTELLTAATSPRQQVILGIYAFDHGLDGQSDLSKGRLPPFGSIAFVSAADVFVPASAQASAAVQIRLHNRGAAQAVTLNVPNWASVNDQATVQFRDYSQPYDGYAGYLVHRLSCAVAAHVQRPQARCE